MKAHCVSAFIVRLLEHKRRQLREQHLRLLAQMRRVLGPERFQRWRLAREVGRPAAPEPGALPELDWRLRRSGSGFRPVPPHGYFVSTFVFPRFDERQWN